MAVSWLRRLLVADHAPGFDFRPAHMGIYGGTPGRALLVLRRLFPVNIVTPMLHNQYFVHLPSTVYRATLSDIAVK